MLFCTEQHNLDRGTVSETGTYFKKMKNFCYKSVSFTGNSNQSTAFVLQFLKYQME